MYAVHINKYKQSLMTINLQLSHRENNSVKINKGRKFVWLDKLVGHAPHCRETNKLEVLITRPSVLAMLFQHILDYRFSSSDL